MNTKSLKFINLKDLSYVILLACYALSCKETFSMIKSFALLTIIWSYFVKRKYFILLFTYFALTSFFQTFLFWKWMKIFNNLTSHFFIWELTRRFRYLFSFFLNDPLLIFLKSVRRNIFCLTTKYISCYNVSLTKIGSHI